MTKITLKSKQRIINKQALDLYNLICTVKKNPHVLERGFEKRLYFCQAVYREFKDVPSGNTVLYELQSYNTNVAYILLSGNTVYLIDVSRYVYGYTSTTAQHVRKFFNLFLDNYPFYRKNNNYIELIYKPC